jgi:DNA-binding MarR family transcriptional regulator
MRLPPRSALEAVYEIVMATTHQAEPALAELGLTMSTAYALWAIDPDEPAPTMKVLARRLRCNASSLTFISDRLLERGYINRTEDPSNRRFRVLSLTPAGRTARQAALDALNKACPLIRLSDGEREDLLKLLGQILIEPDLASGQGTDELPGPSRRRSTRASSASSAASAKGQSAPAS